MHTPIKEEPRPEYNLARLAGAGHDELLITFSKGKLNPELLRIPFVGEVAKTRFIEHGFPDAFTLVAQIIKLNGSLESCMNLFKSIFANSGVPYRKILLVLLFKISLMCDLEDPPVDWEDQFYRRRT